MDELNTGIAFATAAQQAKDSDGGAFKAAISGMIGYADHMLGWTTGVRGKKETAIKTLEKACAALEVSDRTTRRVVKNTKELSIKMQRDNRDLVALLAGLSFETRAEKVADWLLVQKVDSVASLERWLAGDDAGPKTLPTLDEKMLRIFGCDKKHPKSNRIEDMDAETLRLVALACSEEAARRERLRQQAEAVNAGIDNSAETRAERVEQAKRAKAVA